MGDTPINLNSPEQVSQVIFSRILKNKKEWILAFDNVEDKDDFRKIVRDNSYLMVKTKANICISTTGIAGPSGGSKSKPIGLVYIGIRLKGKTEILKKNFNGSRTEIQKKCVNSIFKYLSKLI